MNHKILLDVASTLGKEKLIGLSKEKDVLIKHYLLLEKDKKMTGEEAGDYFLFSFDDRVLYEEEVLKKVLKKTLKSFLKKYHKGGPILFLGLGAKDILGDSFGPRVLDNLIATNSYNDFLTIPKVALFSPDTQSKTGISSFRLIEMVVRSLKPDIIILIDSFKTSRFENLNRTLEVNDCGICLASELRSNKEISRKTFDIPLLTVGYPTMFTFHKTYLNHYLLEKDINIMAKIVSEAFNELILG